jgi:hypothetical protein
MCYGAKIWVRDLRQQLSTWLTSNSEQQKKAGGEDAVTWLSGIRVYQAWQVFIICIHTKRNKVSKPIILLFPITSMSHHKNWHGDWPAECTQTENDKVLQFPFIQHLSATQVQ